MLVKIVATEDAQFPMVKSPLLGEREMVNAQP